MTNSGTRMRIAVIGSTGLIGSAVSRQLGQNHHVVKLARRGPCDIPADLSDFVNIENLSLDGIDAVVHCAGVTDEDFIDNPQRAFAMATNGMAALIKRAAICGVAKFAYISSAHIYGPLVGRIDEYTAPNPLSDYAIAHYASEQILRRAARPEFTGIVVRPCAVFGIPPDFRTFRRWSLIPFGFPRSAVENGAISLRSNGLQQRNFIAADDIGRIVRRLLETAPTSLDFAVVNAVGPETVSVWSFAQLCADIYQELTDEDCSLSRIEDGGHPTAFNYETGHRCYTGSELLRPVVTEFMRRLVEDRKERDQ